MSNPISNGLDGGPLEFDAARYGEDIADFDMTDDQKRELLEILWSIMRAFVDLGFDVGKADPCGQIFGAFNEVSDSPADGVESASSSTMETPADADVKDGQHA